MRMLTSGLLSLVVVVALALSPTAHADDEVQKGLIAALTSQMDALKAFLAEAVKRTDKNSDENAKDIITAIEGSISILKQMSVRGEMKDYFAQLERRVKQVGENIEVLSEVNVGKTFERLDKMKNELASIIHDKFGNGVKQIKEHTTLVSQKSTAEIMNKLLEMEKQIKDLSVQISEIK